MALSVRLRKTRYSTGGTGFVFMGLHNVNTSKLKLVLGNVEKRSRLLSDKTPCQGATKKKGHFAARYEQ